MKSHSTTELFFQQKVFILKFFEGQTNAV